MIYRKIEHKLVNTAVRSSLQVIVKSIVVKNANAWDNVRIAHRMCNSVKSDNIYVEEANGQLRLAVLS